MSNTTGNELVLDVVFYEKHNSYKRGKQLGWQQHITNSFYIARIVGVISGVLPSIVLIPFEVVSDNKDNQLNELVGVLKNKGLSGRIRRRYLKENEELPPILPTAEEVEAFHKKLWGG